jgi:hypothetical protein
MVTSTTCTCSLGLPSSPTATSPRALKTSHCWLTSISLQAYFVNRTSRRRRNLMPPHERLPSGEGLLSILQNDDPHVRWLMRISISRHAASARAVRRRAHGTRCSEARNRSSETDVRSIPTGDTTLRGARQLDARSRHESGNIISLSGECESALHAGFDKTSSRGRLSRPFAHASECGRESDALPSGHGWSGGMERQMLREFQFGTRRDNCLITRLRLAGVPLRQKTSGTGPPANLSANVLWPLDQYMARRRRVSSVLEPRRRMSCRLPAGLC